MTSPTGARAKRPKPEEWSFEVTVRFIPVPDEKREAYEAAIRWMAEQIIEEMQNQRLTAAPAKETVSL